MINTLDSSWIGQPVNVILNGIQQTVTVRDVKWDEAIWNPVTQADGAWMFQIETADGQLIWGYRHNLISPRDN